MRQDIQPDSSKKVFEAFMDFSGGYNSEITNENLKNNEYPVLLNTDLAGRGSARLRSGRTSLVTQAGKAQGTFFYYRDGQPYPDTILAIAGRLYVKTNGTNISTEISILDVATPFTFQATMTIEAVQYKNTMFIATGTKLVELTYDVPTTSWKANVVVPYTVSSMEAIYIGTNGLASNPDAYIQDGAGATPNVEALGIKPALRIAAVNIPVNMTAFINTATGHSGTYDYKWEVKRTIDVAFVVDKDFTAGEKTHSFKFSSPGGYDIRMTVRKTGDATAPASSQIFLLSGYQVRPTNDVSATSPADAIQRCRKILLHWDRILLYGDDKYPFQMYISDLQNPRYFPISNTINFDVGKREAITTAVRFQDMLVVFTKTTVQTLVGKSVEDYRRFQIHDGIGCIAGWSAKVVGNNIYFLSHEGIHALKPNPYRIETMNVARIDGQVKSEMPVDEDACAAVNNAMYWICFPQEKIVYRYYYEAGVWAKDVSDNLDIMQFLVYGEDVYNLTTNGKLLKQEEGIYTDAGALYDMIVETKSLDLSSSFNYKKLKKLYTLGRHYDEHSVSFYVTVYADSALALTPETGQAVIDGEGFVTWQTKTEHNLHFYTGTTFGTWIMGLSPFGNVATSVQKASIRGKCRRVKLRYQAGQGKACELFGFGLEFKMKKP